MYSRSLYDDFAAGNSYGTPNCRACQSRHQAPRGFSNLPTLKRCAGEECLYCEILLQGINRLVPNIETRYGDDARLRFLEDAVIMVYLGANTASKEEKIELKYKYHTMGTTIQNEMSPDATWDDSFVQARQWIAKCFKEHRLCGADEPSTLPTRVLDLGEPGPEPPTYVRLVEDAGREERYVALSHSWGGEQPLQTTTATLSDHKAEIEFGKLPRTFQDAVCITWRLGRRYLWIDSLCILQDNSDDWQNEASRMGQLYRNSWLTLCATSSSSPSTGVMQPNQATFEKAAGEAQEELAILFPEAAKLRRDLRLDLHVKYQHPDFSRWPLGEVNTGFPLLQRGWVYQERLLAPRVLHFGPQEVFWECMQALDCECGDLEWSQSRHMGGYISRDTSNQLPPKISHYAALHIGATASQPSDTRRQEKLLARWGEMVEEYTHRTLTFTTDRLPAFSGVASEMVDRLGMEYCAGIWKETLPAGLLWKGPMNMSMKASLSFADPPSAPSWSWAAVNVPVEYGARPSHGPWEDAAELEDVCCVPAGKDPRGQLRLRDSYIILSVFMLEAELRFEHEGRSYEEPTLPVNKAVESGVKVPFKGQQGPLIKVKVSGREEVFTFMDRTLWDQKGQWVWDPQDQVYCAKMGRTTGMNLYYWLLLRQRKGESVYERIGLVTNTKADWECTTPKQRVKII